jgi:methyl-accepting chemotaxis protein
MAGIVATAAQQIEEFCRCPADMRTSAIRRTLGLKLGLAFAAVLAIMLCALVIVLVQSGKADSAYHDAIAWNQAVAGAAKQADGTRQQQAAQALYVATSEPRYKAEWEAGVAKGEAGGAAVETLHDANVTRIAQGATAADHQHDATVNKELFPAVARGDHAAALKALAKADRFVRVPLEAQGEIAAYVSRAQAKSIAHAKSAAAAAKRSGIIAGLLGTLLAIGITLLVSRGIRRSAASVLACLQALEEHDATELRAGLDAVAAGDLTRSIATETAAIENPGQDELGQIAVATNGIRDRIAGSVEAYNAMRDRLSGLIGEVAGSARSVATASQEMAATSSEAGQAINEIAHAVGEVASGAERQARSVEDVRQAAEAAADTARHSAERAEGAARAADDARGVAHDGAGTAQQAFAAMQAVKESSTEVTGAIRELAIRSGEIVGIVETISGIAAQTNLLALNAAIEAARAGEQGRGFAVVADEVRQLAEGSRTAAESIAVLISQIQTETSRVVEVVEAGAERTAAGTDIVEQTREAFSRIEAAVTDVTTRIEEIAGAALQISEGTAQIQTDVIEVAAVAEQSSAAAQQVSASTQETTASTQEIAASAQELAHTAERLDQLVGSFRL